MFVCLVGVVFIEFMVRFFFLKIWCCLFNVIKFLFLVLLLLILIVFDCILFLGLMWFFEVFLKKEDVVFRSFWFLFDIIIFSKLFCCFLEMYVLNLYCKFGVDKFLRFSDFWYRVILFVWFWLVFFKVMLFFLGFLEIIVLLNLGGVLDKLRNMFFGVVLEFFSCVLFFVFDVWK